MIPTGFIPERGYSLGKPGPRSSKVVALPAPVAGINAVDPIAVIPPQFCLSAVNLIADGRTMKVRPGYRNHASNVGTEDTGVRGIIPFAGGDSANNELFATTEDGIYTVTAGGDGPWVADVSFGTADDESGFGVWTNFVGDNGTHYAFYADESNGLYRYDEGGAWAAVTDITGVDETTLVFCHMHKGRMWFVERDTGTAWYLASGSIAGAATSFNFGNKFIHGGHLVGLWSWTVDGGEGIDDHLVAVSSQGDVMVYKGEDPSSVATWTLVGQYYVGVPPAGRRIAQSQGGDLYILSQYGVIPLTRLMNGALVQQENAQLSRNISPLIADRLERTRSANGWEMRNVPGTNIYLVGTPLIEGDPDVQFVLSTRTAGWTVFEGLPYLTGDVFNGTFYFGDLENSVWILEGDEDGVAEDGSGGDDITWSLQTVFSENGEIGMFHRAQFIRAVFLAAGAPGISIAARFDYDTSPVDAPPAPVDVSGLALWDVAIWDSAIWGSQAVPIQQVYGAAGIGRAVSVSMRGASNVETGLVRFDLIFDTGGML
jgi:hypothetical protein